jgi:hypothetical protein
VKDPRISSLPVFAVACFVVALPAVSTSTPLPSRSCHPERSEGSPHFAVACFILLLDREFWWTQLAKSPHVTKKAAAKAAAFSTAKNKLKSRVPISVAKKRPSTDHVYHAIHHNFTTKTPRLTNDFREKPLQKHQPHHNQLFSTNSPRKSGS